LSEILEWPQKKQQPGNFFEAIFEVYHIHPISEISSFYFQEKSEIPKNGNSIFPISRLLQLPKI
jgi:hypothetical protein